MAQWCVGIDLGGTFIKFGLLDEGGRATETLQLPTPIDDGADAVVAQMIAGARQAIELNGVADEDVLGIGIGPELRGKALRIAHMGHVNAPMILGTLGALEVGLSALAIPHGRGALGAAAEWLGSALNS